LKHYLLVNCHRLNEDHTAPYGDPPGVDRMSPVLFLRELLCLRGARLVPVRCPHPAHLDGLDHHPYASAPALRALSRDDVGRAPHPGVATVERRVGAGRWRAVRRLRTTRDGVLYARVRTRAAGVLRARQGSVASPGFDER
jgi:hypothetical protein